MTIIYKNMHLFGISSIFILASVLIESRLRQLLEPKGEKPCQNPHERTDENIGGIMYTQVNAGIGEEEGPKK